MADIFLSYSRADQEVARRYAKAFEEAGFSVWWDVGLATGEAYDKVTEQALMDARAVVVLWSKTSVDSRWVRAEATQGDRNGSLVPVMIEDCKRPVMFELVQTADLTRWKGRTSDPAWQAFLADVRRIANREDGPAGPALTSSKIAARPIWRKPAVLAGAAVIALAGVGLGLFALRGASGLDPHRIAFFGVTADAGDAVASGMARSATDEVFQTLAAADLQTVARAQTQGVALADQLARAKALGARYALAGDVRTEGAHVRIQLRLDDAATAKTLWEGDVPGIATDTVSLPVLAGSQATRTMRCIVGNLDEIKPVTDRVMAVLPRACAATFSGTPDAARLWAELAALAPKSPGVLSGQAWVTMNTHTTNPDDQRRNEDVGIAAANQALRVQPNNPLARSLLAGVKFRTGTPAAQVERLLLAAIDEAPKDGLQLGVSLTNPISFVDQLRMAAGRDRDALPFARRNVDNDPTNPTIRGDLAATLLRTGQPAEAARLYAEANARNPNQGQWEMWMYDSAFNGLGGADNVIAAAPSSVSQDSINCWKGLIAAAGSSSPALRRAGMVPANQCMASGKILPRNALWIASVLGDLDTAFSLAASHPPPPFMFDRSTRAMREDPRFIPLVTKWGLMDYWKATKSRPDLCETETFPLCAALPAPG